MPVQANKRRLRDGAGHPSHAPIIPCLTLVGMLVLAVQAHAQVAVPGLVDRQNQIIERQQQDRLREEQDRAQRALPPPGARWAAGMEAVATPLKTPGGALYALNVSFPIGDAENVDAVRAHARLLMNLRESLTALLARR